MCFHSEVVRRFSLFCQLSQLSEASACFVLCAGSLCTKCNIPPLLFNVFFWLGYCNSLMNPVIYACSSREFQFAFRRILRCQFRRRPRVFLTDQESSSCHEFNQIDSTSSRAQGHNWKSVRSGKRSKSRKDKFIRTFKSRKSTSRQSSHKQCRHSNLQSFHATRSGDDLHLSESPTESLRALQRKIGEELRMNDPPVTNFAHSDWSAGSGDVANLRRESISNEDLFEDFSKESMYPSCGAR